MKVFRHAAARSLRRGVHGGSGHKKERFRSCSPCGHEQVAVAGLTEVARRGELCATKKQDNPCCSREACLHVPPTPVHAVQHCCEIGCQTWISYSYIPDGKDL